MQSLLICTLWISWYSVHSSLAVSIRTVPEIVSMETKSYNTTNQLNVESYRQIEKDSNNDFPGWRLILDFLISQFYNLWETPEEKEIGPMTCGLVFPNNIPLILFGSPTTVIHFPWHVLLYTKLDKQYFYICGGSIVSKNKVVTAAHCVTDDDNDYPISPSQFIVHLGENEELNSSSYLSDEYKMISRIDIHPDFNVMSPFDDIAVLTLESNIEYKPNISPVCIWNVLDFNPNDYVGQVGTVIGRGVNENNTLSETFAAIQMPIVSNEECIASFPEVFMDNVNDRTFCAGYRNGSIPCDGDSGSSLVMKIDDKWFLVGVVSRVISSTSDSQYLCDGFNYALFTDARKHMRFIAMHL